MFFRLVTNYCKYYFCKKEENRSTFSANVILAGVYVTFAVQDFTTFSNRRSEVRYTHKKPLLLVKVVREFIEILKEAPVVAASIIA